MTVAVVVMVIVPVMVRPARDQRAHEVDRQAEGWRPRSPSRYWMACGDIDALDRADDHRRHAEQEDGTGEAARISISTCRRQSAGPARSAARRHRPARKRRSRRRASHVPAIGQRAIELNHQPAVISMTIAAAVITSPPACCARRARCRYRRRGRGPRGQVVGRHGGLAISARDADQLVGAPCALGGVGDRRVGDVGEAFPDDPRPIEAGTARPGTPGPPGRGRSTGATARTACRTGKEQEVPSGKLFTSYAGA